MFAIGVKGPALPQPRHSKLQIWLIWKSMGEPQLPPHSCPPQKGGVLSYQLWVKGWDQWPLLRAETSTVG